MDVAALVEQIKAAWTNGDDPALLAAVEHLDDLDVEALRLRAEELDLIKAMHSEDCTLREYNAIAAEKRPLSARAHETEQAATAIRATVDKHNPDAVHHGDGFTWGS